MFNFNHVKNRLIDVGMYIRRNTSIIFYIFIAVIIVAYASLYMYKTYFTTEASTITEEQKYKDIMLNNNIFQLVENEYNPETGFYVAKFILKERNNNAPVIANDTLEVSGISRLDNNVLEELNIESKQITPTYFILEISNLPKDQVELRLDFNLSNLALDKEKDADSESLYTFISEEEMNTNLSALTDEAYKEESYQFEIDNVNAQIDDMNERIQFFDNQISVLEEQIESSESELKLMTDSEKDEMESSIEGQKSEIEDYEKEIEKFKESIAEREEKLSILESNL